MKKAIAVAALVGVILTMCSGCSKTGAPTGTLVVPNKAGQYCIISTNAPPALVTTNRVTVEVAGK